MNIVKANANSNSIADFSLLKEKNENSKSHLFYNLDKNLNFDYFEDSNLTLKIQKTSNDTYLELIV